MRHLAAATRARYLVLLTWLASPLTLLLAFSFMTQIYAATALMLAMLLLFKGYREGSVWLIASSTVVVLAAVLIRQNAAIWFVALALSAMSARKSRRGKILLASAGAGAALVAGMLLFTAWLTPSGSQFAAHADPIGVGQRWTSLSRVVFAFPQHAALAFAPPVIIFGLLIVRSRSARTYSIVAALFVLFLLRAEWMPGVAADAPVWSMLQWPDVQFGSLFTNFSLGPPTLIDVSREGLATPFAAREWLRAVVTISAALGGAVVLVGSDLVRRDTRHSERAFEMRFISNLFLGGMIMLGAGNLYFDRYVVDAGWPLLLLAVPLVDRFPKGAAAGVIAALLIAGLSSLAVHEYLSWNRARWALVERAPSLGIDAATIDGGYEVNAWMPRKKNLDLQAPIESFGKPYVITFQPLPGSRVVATEPFSALRQGDLYLLEFRGAR